MNKYQNSTKWDKIYSEQDINDIPWNFEETPQWFRKIIESGSIRPCKTLDIGCGLGHYAKFLSDIGYQVTAIDYSQVTIEKAVDKYGNSNPIFKVCDAFELESLNDTFDFIFDVSLFHHITPEYRKNYCEQIFKTSSRGAKILICCFSDQDQIFKGQMNFTNPDSNTVTYVLSKSEIFETFEDNFIIEDFREISFGKKSKIGDSMERKRHLVLLKKK